MVLKILQYEESTRRRSKKELLGNDTREKVENFNQFEELARATSRINFGKLAPSDTEEGTKKLCRSLKMSRSHGLIAHEKPTGTSSNKRSMKVFSVRVYATAAQKLLEIGAVTYLSPSRLVSELKLALEVTYINMKVANGKMSATRWIVRDVAFSRKSAVLDYW